MNPAGERPTIRVALDTNVWIWSIKAETFEDILTLGKDHRVQWLMPWDVDQDGKSQQILVRELSGKEYISVSQIHINRLLKSCTQTMMNEQDADRFFELFTQFPPAKNIVASKLRFSSQVGDLKRPHEGEIACIVAAEKENAFFCSMEKDARAFAISILGEERVFSIQTLFNMLYKRGIDLPGKLRTNPGRK